MGRIHRAVNFIPKRGERLRLGLIGLGRWGLNYLNTLLKMSEVELVRIAGRQYQSKLAERFSNTIFTDDWGTVVNDKSLNGIIIATPPNSHFLIAKSAIESKIPILVEKPFTLSASMTNELRLLSEVHGTFCMINYIHLFAPGYRELKSRVEYYGRITSIWSENFGDGPFRTDVPVLWDWGCHEIAKCIDLLRDQPITIEISELKLADHRNNSRLFGLSLTFPKSIKVRCVFGNASELKRLKFGVTCERGSFTYDGLSQELSSKPSINEQPEGDSFRRNATPLECAINEFILAIRTGKTSHFTIRLACQVNELLEKIEKILISRQGVVL